MTYRQKQAKRKSKRLQIREAQRTRTHEQRRLLRRKKTWEYNVRGFLKLMHLHNYNSEEHCHRRELGLRHQVKSRFIFTNHFGPPLTQRTESEP
jgi:hypothetical protein